MSACQSSYLNAIACTIPQKIVFFGTTMSESKWHIIPGKGAQYLDTISDDVKTCLRLSNALPDYEQYVRNVGASAIDIGQSVAETSLVSDDLAIGESLTGLLSEEEQSIINQAFLSKLILEGLKSLKNGRNLGSEGRLAQLTVTNNGVLRKRVHQHKDNGLRVPIGLGLVVPDTVIEGKIRQFSSKPEDGGTLRLDHRMSSSYLQGLVDPSTGNPRVNLEILSK